MTVGGHPYPPRRARLERLLEQLRDGLVSGRTLAGCRILPWRGALLICREAQAIEDEALLAPGVPLRWDGRFRLQLNGKAALTVRALGRDWHARARRRLEPGAAGAGASEPALALAPGATCCGSSSGSGSTLARGARHDRGALQPRIATGRSAIPRRRFENIETVASIRRDLMLEYAVGRSPGTCEPAGADRDGEDRQTRHRA